MLTLPNWRGMPTIRVYDYNTIIFMYVLKICLICEYYPHILYYDNNIHL